MRIQWVLPCVLACSSSHPGKAIDAAVNIDTPADVPVDAMVDAPPQPAMLGKLVTNDVDLLLVVDNSASTTDKQTQLATAFPAVVAAFDALPNGRPNLHIGVVDSTVDIGVQGFGPGCPSPDPNDDGVLHNSPHSSGCTGPTGMYIVDISDGSGGRTTNYSNTQTLADTLSCIAQIGATGCGFEAQLEGMKRALDGSRSQNAGFRRSTAALAILILTDEDDASVADTGVFSLGSGATGPGDFRLQPLYAYTCDQAISASGPGTYTNCAVRTGSYLKDPAIYYEFLKTVVDPSALVVEAITGPATSNIATGAITTPFNQTLALLPSCTATIGGNPAIARPGIRLTSFVGHLGNHGAVSSACATDYTPALQDLASRVALAISPCYEGSLDTTDVDAANPGLQLACSATAGGATIPACSMSDATTPAGNTATPCYWLEANSSSCPSTATHVVVHPVGTLAGPLSLSCKSG